MAAFLKFDLTPRVADTVAQLRGDVQAAVRQQANARPVLVCQWQQDADGRLSCYWEFASPDAAPVTLGQP